MSVSAPDKRHVLVEGDFPLGHREHCSRDNEERVSERMGYFLDPRNVGYSAFRQPVRCRLQPKIKPVSNWHFRGLGDVGCRQQLGVQETREVSAADKKGDPLVTNTLGTWEMSAADKSCVFRNPGMCRLRRFYEIFKNSYCSTLSGCQIPLFRHRQHAFFLITTSRWFLNHPPSKKNKLN